MGNADSTSLRKKKMQNEAKNPTAVAYAVENTQTLNPMDYWLRRYGVYDKDAHDAENTTPFDNPAEKRRLRTMRPQAQIDLHGMTLEGNHSQNGPILARFVQKFLETNAYAGETGHPKGRDGGTGSTWVILK